MQVALYRFGEQTAVGGKIYSRAFFCPPLSSIIALESGTIHVSKYLFPNVGGFFRDHLWRCSPLQMAAYDVLQLVNRQQQEIP